MKAYIIGIFKTINYQKANEYMPFAKVLLLRF